MPQVEDESYCNWVARRAVARAALHLGIEDMTEETLHVLSTCLLDYLRRIGKYTAANAEASGRATSHCNVLDAIRAVELCTSPSAINGSLKPAGEQQDTEEGADDVAGAYSEGEAHHSPSNYPINSWKSLAHFCFGLDWDQEDSAVATAAVGRGIGSKGAAVEDTVVSKIQKKGGWSAPFPEEIPTFPTRSSRLQDDPLHANAAAESRVVQAQPTVANVDNDGDQNMKDADDSEERNDTSGNDKNDEEHTKLWGVLLQTTAAKQQTTADHAELSVPTASTKKRKVDQIHEDPFLPVFYPPQPATAAKKVAKVDEGVPEKPASDADAEALMSVRAALVVPAGLPTKAIEPKAIVPVARASSAPVSRILEGSMDPAQT